MTTFPVGDTLIGPIADQLLSIAQNQIQGITTVYPYEPNGQPDDHSLVVMPPTFEVKGDTNGRLELELTFGMRFRIRSVDNASDLATLYGYLPPFLLAYSDWVNQDLNGNARIVSVKNGGFTKDMYAAVAYRVLVVNVTVQTEYLIPTS